MFSLPQQREEPNLYILCTCVIKLISRFSSNLLVFWDTFSKIFKFSIRLLEVLQMKTFLLLLAFRELAFQISEQFEALGSSIGVKCGKPVHKEIYICSTQCCFSQIIEKKILKNGPQFAKY